MSFRRKLDLLVSVIMIEEQRNAAIQVLTLFCHLPLSQEVNCLSKLPTGTNLGYL